MGYGKVCAQYSLSGNTATVTIPSVALVDIEPSSGSISLVLTQPTEAGQTMTNSSATNNSKWINYSSSNSTAVTRKITVQITSGSVPSGLVIDLTASSYSGSGVGGTFGSPGSTIQINTSAQNLITGISSCHTGDGTSNGHQLTYTMRITNYANVKTVTSGTLLVNYTLMDN